MLANPGKNSPAGRGSPPAKRRRLDHQARTDREAAAELQDIRLKRSHMNCEFEMRIFQLVNTYIQDHRDLYDKEAACIQRCPNLAALGPPEGVPERNILSDDVRVISFYPRSIRTDGTAVGRPSGKAPEHVTTRSPTSAAPDRDIVGTQGSADPTLPPAIKDPQTTSHMPVEQRPTPDPIISGRTRRKSIVVPKGVSRPRLDPSPRYSPGLEPNPTQSILETTQPAIKKNVVRKSSFWVFEHGPRLPDQPRLYTLRCPSVSCQQPVFSRHPFRLGTRNRLRAVEHFAACGIPFRNIDDIVHRYAQQVKPDRPSRKLTESWAKSHNESLIGTNESFLHADNRWPGLEEDPLHL
ncbi:hypothetical protein B0H66DRAFT_102468 [Apodospora peruviana]|uniref:Uncharacterized protein n=1 Tax=Apodospora peruviana TaxID=516989 RepID=A0AAE0HS60_9PEZI|nr:hypothetical protein B0H66DRAFT_102468 [Apodospora peruviana]